MGHRAIGSPACPGGHIPRNRRTRLFLQHDLLLICPSNSLGMAIRTSDAHSPPPASRACRRPYQNTFRHGILILCRALPLSRPCSPPSLVFVRAGALFIQEGWWHQVTSSSGMMVAVTVWFKVNGILLRASEGAKEREKAPHATVARRGVRNSNHVPCGWLV